MKKAYFSNQDSWSGKLSTSDWVMGFFGLIPVMGVIMGAILAFEGFRKKNSGLILIGAADIIFTFLFVGVIFPNLKNSGVLLESNIKLTNHYLDQAVKDLEYYRQVNGKYPSGLREMSKHDEFSFYYEVFEDDNFFEKDDPVEFHYKKQGDGYILKSAGPDRILNTPDDIYPQLKLKRDEIK